MAGPSQAFATSRARQDRCYPADQGVQVLRVLLGGNSGFLPD